MKTILMITITMLLTACATTHSKCDAYGSVETSKDLAKK
jgi:uncharacterized lipoprotein YmbA